MLQCLIGAVFEVGHPVQGRCHVVTLVSFNKPCEASTSAESAYLSTPALGRSRESDCPDWIITEAGPKLVMFLKTPNRKAADGSCKYCKYKSVKALSFKGSAQERRGLPVLCHRHAGRPSECYYAVWFECQLQGHFPSTQTIAVLCSTQPDPTKTFHFIYSALTKWSKPVKDWVLF